MKPIISVQNLSKRYKLGVFNAKTLREEAEAFLARFGRKKAELAGGSSQLAGKSSHAEPSSDFWALRDVSFDVQPGEVIGVIGRNGAGKSTLLKILSRITEPTSGEARIRGRVASLLEVGTGFHPELSGRENVFLNGAILGMTKQEIRNKFDEIVAFAEIEKFIDTPVKRYSSGMYVRLAFAVAAHLEPEILIVDEVLAVGDAEFQKKCLGKIQEVSGNDGRTVLFVSHNMAAVSSLTDRCVVMRGGKICFDGKTSDAVATYLQSNEAHRGRYCAPQPATSTPRIDSIEISSFRQGACTHISGDDFVCTFVISHTQPINGACLSCQIINQYQQPVVHCWLYDSDQPWGRVAGGSTLVCRIPKLALNIGQYHLNVYLAEPPGGKVFETIEGVCVFDTEIVGKQTLYGWRSDACAYIVESSWKTLSEKK